MSKLWIDFETFSATPIKYGTHVYAADAEIIVCAYAFDDEPVQVFDSEEIPDKLRQALHDDSIEIWAHNSAFDRVVMRHAWGIVPAHTLWRDTMVQALSHSLPASLGTLCEVLGMPSDKSKDKAGKKLIQLFCKPRGKNVKIRRATKETHPEEWAAFLEYARMDVEAMRAAHKLMPMWNYKGVELDLWHLDQKINDRGMCVDVELAHAAVAAIGVAQHGLAARTKEVTEGDVESATKRDALLKHILEAYGVVMLDLQKATVALRLEDDDLDPGLRELLELRQQASTSSTAKYKTLLQAVCTDGRLRNTKQFNGASRTGRWAGRLFQPDNLPRPTLSQGVIDSGIEAIKAGCADLVTDNVMQLVSSAIRSTIKAEDGNKLVISDLANIEGRTQAWLVGEDWKIQAFRDYDAGTGPDLYILSYSKSFGVPVEQVTKEQRQIGKVQELALAYASGVGGFATFASAYNIDVEELALKVLPVAQGDVVEQSSSFYDWTVKQGRDTYDMSRDAFVACEVIKRGWRAAHPNMVAYWKELNECVGKAILQKDTTFACGKLRVRRSGNWLRIGLPSGRALCYPFPEVEVKKVERQGRTVTSYTVSYMGVDQFTRKWKRQFTHGGKLYENVNQAVARDVLAANMPAIDDAGYGIILTVHDEIISETPDTLDFNHETLSRMMALQPAWALDLPLSSAGFETKAYRKD